MLKQAVVALRSQAGLAQLLPASGSQMQVIRGIFGVDKDKSEPAASPWIKVLERPGADPSNRSEENPAENPYANRASPDVSDDVPEKNPDTQPQAPIDPEVLAAAEANPSVDSMRHMAGKLNEAVGGSYDFPKTGGASIHDMASEIGENVGDRLGVHISPDKKVTSKAEEAVEHAADRVAEGASSAYEKVKGTVKQATSSSSDKDRST